MRGPDLLGYVVMACDFEGQDCQARGDGWQPTLRDWAAKDGHPARNVPKLMNRGRVETAHVIRYDRFRSAIVRAKEYAKAIPNKEAKKIRDG